MKFSNQICSRALATTVTTIRGARAVTTMTTTALAGLVALAIMLGFAGCSSSKKDNRTSVSTSNQEAIQRSLSDPGGSPAAAPALTPVANVADQAVTPKKKVAKLPATASYINSESGFSLRYPRKATVMTPEKAKMDSDLLERAPMKFVADGGRKVTALDLTGTPASFFNVSVNKNLNEDQCGQFSFPQAKAATDETGARQISEDDPSIPVKLTLDGVDFSRVENVTDQGNVRYYHSFQNGTCYEFALGVLGSSDDSKSATHDAQFAKLEKILASVKMKTEDTPAETAAAPQTVPNPQ